MKEFLGRFVNLPLIANPFNWVYIIAVAFFVGLALSLIFPNAPTTTSAPATGDDQ